MSALFEWEESDRRAQEIFFRADEEFAPDLEPDPNAFLIAGYLPALRHGERRIRIAGPVCPMLRSGLLRASRVFDAWAGRRPRAIAVEPSGGFDPPRPFSGRAAAFFSGGIDSSHLLYANRVDFSDGHPDRVRDALFVEGSDFPGEEETPAAANHAWRVRQRLAETASDGGVELVSIASNVRSLDPDLDFYAREYLGATLAAAAAVFPRRFSSARIASGADVAHLGRWGTHPLIDSNYSTAALTVEHEGLGWTRFEKVSALARWPEAIENLVVCNYRPVFPWVNCGVCEKCVATMLELTAAGVMPQNRSFPFAEVTPEHIGRVPSVSGVAHIWRRIRAEMIRTDRPDLTRAIDDLFRRTRLRDFARAARRILPNLRRG